MFEFIKKYSNGSFSFGIEDNLKAKCMEIQYENIDKCCGVYIVYGYPKDKGDKEIVYIGSSGHFEDNRPIPRKGGGSYNLLIIHQFLDVYLFQKSPL